MATTRYSHSAYWYAQRYGWTHSEAASLAGQYLDFHTYRLGPKRREDGEWNGKEWMSKRNASICLDSQFNPLIFGVCIAMDIGIAMRDEVRKLSNPKERDRMKRELLRNLRAVRRPFYYAHETERRRRLAAERRKINRRYTTAPAPTPDGILAAWNARKESREAIIMLGGMIHDLECYVDNCLRFDESGAVVGRNGGIRGWLRENIPELSPKYKTLMRYKALAMRLRQATGTKDPTPTSALLVARPRHEVVAALLADSKPVFENLFSALDRLLAPETVFLDEPKIHVPKKIHNGKIARDVLGLGRRKAKRKSAKRKSKKRSCQKHLLQ